jgi:rhamnulokinase
LSSDPLFAAVDLGAGSGRVFLAGVAPGELRLDEVRRFQYPPREAAGHLRWDAARIFAEIEAGLRAAGERARALGRPLRSIGVDSWGVDYALLDAEGRLLEDPVCYRDARTRGVPARVFAQGPPREVFRRTGIQVLDFNTLFQLDAHRREGLPPGAHRLLLIPDLVNHRLTGRAVTEYTNATTTQLVDAATCEWDRDLAERLELPGSPARRDRPRRHRPRSARGRARAGPRPWKAFTSWRPPPTIRAARWRARPWPKDGPTSRPAPGRWWGSSARARS